MEVAFAESSLDEGEDADVVDHWDTKYEGSSKGPVAVVGDAWFSLLSSVIARVQYNYSHMSHLKFKKNRMCNSPPEKDPSTGNLMVQARQQE